MSQRPPGRVGYLLVTRRAHGDLRWTRLSVWPGEEVYDEEDVFSVVEVHRVSSDHDFTYCVRRRAQHHDYTRQTCEIKIYTKFHF